MAFIHVANDAFPFSAVRELVDRHEIGTSDIDMVEVAIGPREANGGNHHRGGHRYEIVPAVETRIDGHLDYATVAGRGRHTQHTSAR